MKLKNLTLINKQELGRPTNSNLFYILWTLLWVCLLSWIPSLYQAAFDFNTSFYGVPDPINYAILTVLTLVFVFPVYTMNNMIVYMLSKMTNNWQRESTGYRRFKESLFRDRCVLCRKPVKPRLVRMCDDRDFVDGADGKRSVLTEKTTAVIHMSCDCCETSTFILVDCADATGKPRQVDALIYTLGE